MVSIALTPNKEIWIPDLATATFAASMPAALIIHAGDQFRRLFLHRVQGLSHSILIEDDMAGK